MKQRHFLMSMLLLCVLPFQVFAQINSDAPTEKHFFANIQWAQSRYELLFPSKNVGIQPMDNIKCTLGYWVRPRLAFQASITWDQQEYNTVDYGTNSSGAPISESYKSVQTGTAIPLLLRYTLTRKPDHRVQFDVLGGATLVFAKYTLDLKNTEAGIVTREYHRDEQADGTVRLTAGLSGRYRVYRRLEIIADATWSKNPKLVSDDQHRSLGNRWGITKSLSLGLNYPFGLNRHSSKQ